MKGRIVALLATTLVVGGLTVGVGSTAQASGGSPGPAAGAVAPQAATTAHQKSVCTGNGSGTPCVNEWGGNTALGGAIKVYAYPSYPNELWQYNFVDPCNSGSTVTHTCPFTVGTGMNDEFFGDAIVQVAYTGGTCMATNGSGTAVNGVCATNGTPSNGVYMILDGTGDCIYTNYCAMINRYWSNNRGVPQFVCSRSTANGALIDLDKATNSCASNTAFWHMFF